MFYMQRYRYCFLAGCFAAGGSFFGKMPSFLESIDLEVSKSHKVFIIIKYLPIALMIICNVLNWRYFLKALQLTEQTLTATVLTSASNYIVSFILASLIYKEPITGLSTFGTTLIVLGLWFLCDDPNKKAPTKSKDT
uniref:EamA domain-containing protein n=1 Tax=Musca domestica TaxID=7370 RepID=A0A1I8MSZ8_MUSDO